MKKSILGLFPDFKNGSVGGIQISGALAWQAIQEQIKKTGGKSHLFFYPESPVKVSSKLSRILDPRKISVLFKALYRNWKFEVVLIWHVDLLKYLPFFRLSDVKIVLFLHGIEVWRRQDFLTRRLLKRVKLFLSNSDYTWQEFLQLNPCLGGIQRCRVHLGISQPIDSFLPSPISSPVVLMISRLSRLEDYKGHREMIDVWPMIREKIPDAELWIAGDGDLRRDLERIVKERNLTETIRFLGSVSEAKKMELLAQSRCLAMPSRGEGFGLVYLEAMRLGRPCLVSTLDAGREVVKPPEAGLAVDPRKPEQLFEAICQLLTPGTEWETWSERARKRYENFFTEKHFQERLLAAFSVDDF